MKKLLGMLMLVAALFAVGCNEKTDERTLLSASSNTAAKPEGRHHATRGELLDQLMQPEQVQLGGTVTVDSVVVYRPVASSADWKTVIYGHIWTTWPICTTTDVYAEVDWLNGVGTWVWTGEVYPDGGSASLAWIEVTIDQVDDDLFGTFSYGDNSQTGVWGGIYMDSVASAMLWVQATANPLNGCNKIVDAHTDRADCPLFTRY